MVAVAAAQTVNAWGLANVTLCRYSGWRGTTQWLGENTVVMRQYNDLPDAIVSRYRNMRVIFYQTPTKGLITAVLRLLSKLWIHQTVGRSIV